MRDILVLMNSLSGRASEEGCRAIREELRPILESHGTPRFVTAPVPELMEEAGAFRGDTVVSVGGDGTIAAISSKLYMREDPPLFVPLPYGTANLIPRDIGLTMPPVEALRRSLSAPPRMIDYVEADDRALLHSAAFGTLAEIAEGREDLRKAPTFGDALGAAQDMWDRFIGTQGERYRITIDGETRDVSSSAVFVVNNAITGGENGLPRRKNLDRGELAIYISKSTDVWGLMQHIIEALAGAFDRSPDFDRRTGKEVTVETLDRELHYTIDGEPYSRRQSVHFVMHGCSLKVPDLR